ncbi:hypothetical protein F5Y15DRAFT_4277 [Xylariaceae sp. FL0016]|nr:hypothetical protein F5Y15DRAFT_4277 [Xylariaceae sp. FL0016]
MEFHYQEPLSYPGYIDGSDLHLPLDSIMDSKMKRLVSPHDLSCPWSVEPPQMHHFLADSNNSSFIGYHLLDSVLPGTVPTFPSTLIRRQSSPSYSQPSSCSSKPSPPRESDYCQAHSPSTPSDATPMSPYAAANDYYGSHGQLFQHTGLAVADDCVKPVDVNPFQETPIGYYDGNSQAPEPPCRSFTMSSDDSSISLDHSNGSGNFHITRQLSPESCTPEVKEEIFIPEKGESYLEDGETSEEDSEVPEVKHENDDDDDEYTPSKKAKRTCDSLRRSSKGRKRSSASLSVSGSKRIKLEVDDSSSIKAPGKPDVPSCRKPAIQGTRGQFACSECPKNSFKDQNSLNAHIKKQHTRPFTCVFEFAGCSSTFASKNEWKRHCQSQHLLLNYWICQQDGCAKVSNCSSKPTTSTRNRNNTMRPPCTESSNLPNGTIFNRKDLFTQHLRRLHVPSTFKKQVKQKKAVPGWDERERGYQEAARRTRCQLPTHMRCPAANCSARFDGCNAWDDRMEHVAKHLEQAASGAELPLKFGGDHDKTLIDWATGADVAIVARADRGHWELRNPLKPISNSRKSPVLEDEDDGDADAEGEEVEY